MFWQARTIAELEADLVDVEAKIAGLRAEQVVLVNELDKAQAPQSDASRSMVDWIQAHMDVRRDTARDLVFAARSFARYRSLNERMINGNATFDRTIATVKLSEAGASRDEVDESYERDLAGVTRMLARRRHITPGAEQEAFDRRFFSIQPNLDESSYRLCGELPGLAGRTVEKAIHERSDAFRRIAAEIQTNRGQRQADALTALAQDSLDGTAPEHTAGGHVTVFVDARRENAAETTAEIEYGPRVGPNTLQAMLCGSPVQVVGLDANGNPVVTSPAARSITRSIRHHVAHRDGGCVVDGCHSRYRLQPHHIHRFAHGGTHEPKNLATLCWYHHHVAIHQNGYRIDPSSPPLRRRLVRGSPIGPDPP
ncbi:MAG: HNH endonuclease signature motif containing protein [Actinomycetota bacterium]